jgi:type IV pilus assembly protein PilV
MALHGDSYMNISFYEDNQNNARGFTIIEAMIALVVLSVSLLALAGLTATLIARNKVAHQITEATTLAQDKIEELKNKPFVSVTNETSTNSIYSIATSVLNHTTWKDVAVTVSWHASPQLNSASSSPHSVTLKTIIVNLE